MANDTKASANGAQEPIRMVKYIAINQCFYNGVWLDRNYTIDIPSNVVVTHTSLKPYDEQLVTRRIEELGMYNPIADALEKRRIAEVTSGVTPNY